MKNESLYYDEIRKFAEIELQICNKDANTALWYFDLMILDSTMLTDLNSLDQLISSKAATQAIVSRIRMYYTKLMTMLGKDFMDVMEERKMQAMKRLYNHQIDTISVELAILLDIKMYFMEKRIVEWFGKDDRE